MPAPISARPTCHRCHKPAPLCVCASVRRVQNRTRVVVLRHRRERFHVVGTTRIARLGLAAVDVHDVTYDLPPLALPPGAALLYPAEGARDLATLPEHERPSCLVVLDGTWHHARRLYRDNPWLAALPAVRLSPEAPSRYRIRRQARPEHLSTIESIVAALQALEPDTPGLDDLLDAFDAMIDAQQAHMQHPADEPRFQRRLPRPARAVPARLLEHPERLLVVYGETAPLHGPGGGRGRQLVTWTAVRPASGESFERVLQPRGTPPCAEHLAHLALPPEALSHAVPLEFVARDWRAFRRADDIVVAWNAGRLRMLRVLDEHPGQPLQLKSLWCNVTHVRPGSLDELVASLGLSVEPVAVQGRAALRLGQAVAVARDLLRVAPRMARVRDGGGARG